MGEEAWLNLELKVMADVAIVGFPNAGKSTLISAISAAKPKIAAYPFTTLQPHLGVVRFDDHELVVADIPGLVEGASEGKGLGHRFLRHIERARVLLVLVDMAPDDGRAPADQERVLLKELENYEPELLERPRLVVGSRADLATEPRQRRDGRAARSSRPVPARGSTGCWAAWPSWWTRPGRPSPGPAGSSCTGPPASGVVVQTGPDGALEVRGRQAERAVALSDLTDAGALAYAQGRLKRLGVDRALVKAGARPGDRVRIGRLRVRLGAGLSGRRCRRAAPSW